VIIGKNNVIREYVTIHSSSGAGQVTSIGDNNFFMAFAHVAHDCDIKNNVVLCNGVLVAGHVQISDWAFLSGYVGVHQFVRIGRCAMIGGLTRVTQDVPPFMMVVGNSRVWGLNMVGLKRRGFSLKDIGEIKKAFQIIYRDKLSQANAMERLKNIESPLIKEIADFVESAKRGICGPQKSSFIQKLFLDYPYFLLLKIDVYRLFFDAQKTRGFTANGR
jgi:UDP-N-acetylglucosamine acyltransferase